MDQACGSSENVGQVHQVSGRVSFKKLLSYRVENIILQVEKIISYNTGNDQ